MLSIDKYEIPRCRDCGKELVIFYLGAMATACCSNTRCQAYKQPQNIERGEKNGEKGKAKKVAQKKFKKSPAYLKKGAKSTAKAK